MVLAGSHAKRKIDQKLASLKGVGVSLKTVFISKYCPDIFGQDCSNPSNSTQNQTNQIAEILSLLRRDNIRYGILPRWASWVICLWPSLVFMMKIKKIPTKWLDTYKYLSLPFLTFIDLCLLISLLWTEASKAKTSETEGFAGAKCVQRSEFWEGNEWTRIRKGMCLNVPNSTTCLTEFRFSCNGFPVFEEG